MRTLEETIKTMADFASIVQDKPNYIEVYNLMLKGVEIRYRIPRVKLLQMLYNEVNKK